MQNLQNRRNFLGFSAMAALGVVPARGVSRTVARGAGAVGLGVASYTFRNFERAKLIEYVQQLGVSTVNLKNVKDHLPSSSIEEETKALEQYRAAGIQPTAVGTIYFRKDEDADIRQKFEYAKLAGVKVIVAGDPDVAVLPRLERFVKEYDIRIAVHNHGPEDKIWKSPLDVLRAVQGMDVRLGCCIDVGHTMRCGQDVVEVVRTVGPRLHNMHMKDLAKADAKESQVAVGRGIMPVKAIFAELTRMKYPGNVDLEYEIEEENPMPGVIESLAYMRGVQAGM